MPKSDRKHPPAEATAGDNTGELTKPDKRTRAQKVKDRLFPEDRAFDPKRKYFVPLAWVYRRLLHVISPRDWMVLTWLMMNASKEGVVVELNRRELMHDMDYQAASKLAKSLEHLEEQGLIKRKVDRGKEHVLIIDPFDAVVHMAKVTKMLNGERLQHVNDLLEEIGRDQVEV